MLDIDEWWLSEPYLESEPQSHKKQVHAAIEAAMAKMAACGSRTYSKIPVVTVERFEKGLLEQRGCTTF